MEPFAGWPPWQERRLDHSAVNVWGIRVAAGVRHLERLRTLLTDDERERAARFGSDTQRTPYVVAHGALHEILGVLTGEDPASIGFEFDDNGRPLLASGADIDFNLSHAGDVAVIATGLSMRVGVDVELTTREIDYISMAGRFFARAEMSEVSVRGRPAFFDYWCKKEAVAKAVGLGVSISLSSFVVSPEPQQKVDVPGRGSWHVCALQPRGGYVAAVAAGRPAPVATWLWAPHAV